MRSSQPGLSSVASPSRRTTISPSACWRARLSVSTIPVGGLRRSVKRSKRPDARQRSRTSTERSVEPSSTKMSSKSGWVVWAASFSRNRSRTGSLFRFGTISETTALRGRGGGLGGREALVDAQRLAHDLVHVQVLVAGEPPHEGDPGLLGGERLVALVELLVLRSGHRVV